MGNELHALSITTEEKIMKTKEKIEKLLMIMIFVYS